MSVEDILDRAGVQTYRDKKRGWNAMRDLTRSGELRRVDRGRYRYVGKPNGASKKQAVMWRFLRMRRMVTADDLIEVSGASRDYVLEWLRNLVRQEVVRRRGDGAFMLTQEIPEAEPPMDEAKAEKLRALRARKKAVGSALREIGEAFGKLADLVESEVE